MSQNASQSASQWTPAALAGTLLIALISLAGPAAAARYYGVTNFPITGSEVVPPNPSSAYGYGSVVIDTDIDEFQFDIALVGIVGEIESQIHGFAGPGANATVIFELPTADHEIGVWNYAEDEEANILAGRTTPASSLRSRWCPGNA